MKPFLETVAQDIIRKCGTDLSRTAVVFPNKRASLFLNEYLAKYAAQPIWSPAYITISDLFRRHSTLEIADEIKLVCDLHKTYLEVTGLDESLDHFYAWGRLMLSDFDDIDKNMADASKVFANVRDVHELDDLSYLSSEQEAVLRTFFSNFSIDDNTELKRRFLVLWNNLSAVYHSYAGRLRRQGLAYEGSLYRTVALDDTVEYEYDRYIFVGFNMVHPVEQQLFLRLKQQGKAMFYWDFDHYYLPIGKSLNRNLSEAGHYIASYLEKFPNELDNTDVSVYDNFSKQKSITFISAKTEDIQARYIAQWLQENDRIPAGRRTAVVMCNEALLTSAIHSLPDEVEHVNITTGYPLSQSPLCSDLFMEVRKAKTLADFVERGKEYITNTAQNIPDSSLDRESLFRLYTIIQRLEGLIAAGDLDVNVITLQKLLQQLIQTATVPFHGEPAVGLQLMGVLETRNLDFDHLLILSCSEGNVPRGINDSSFIPYSVRKAYGLTTIDHKVAIYAYYFHRLLQRAGDISIVYNSATEDGSKGEMSRFMLQLMVESGQDIQFRTIVSDDNLQFANSHLPFNHPEVRIVNAKLSNSKSSLSPTAICKFMRCRKMYYYHYILGIRELEDEEETIDNRVFGNIFHAASETLYKRHLIKRNGTVDKADIEYLLKKGVEIERVVDETFAEETHLTAADSGLALINREVIIRYLRLLLEKDLALAPFQVIGLEIDVDMEVNDCKLYGRIDRLDCITDASGTRIRVVDYKTGARSLTPLADVDAIFDPANVRNHADYYLQTMLYSIIVRHDKAHNPNGLPVTPALLFIQKASGDDYDPTLKFKSTGPILDVADFEGDFIGRLKEVIAEMFSSDLLFTPTGDEKVCTFCPYAQLCRR